MLYVQVGVGVNVANPKPTVSINALIEAHNATVDDASERLPLLSLERLLAAFLKRFEAEFDTVFSTINTDTGTHTVLLRVDTVSRLYWKISFHFYERCKRPATCSDCWSFTTRTGCTAARRWRWRRALWSESSCRWTEARRRCSRAAASERHRMGANA